MTVQEQEAVGSEHVPTPTAPPRRWWPLAAALPVAVGAVLVLTAGEPDTAAAVARTGDGTELCLQLAGAPGSSAAAAVSLVCLDASHREHLPVGGVTDGDCVEVSYVGETPTNRTVVGVRAATCPAGAPR